MSIVTFPSVARPAQITLRNFRNGVYPDAAPITRLHEEANRVAFFRVKSWMLASPITTAPAAGGSSRTRWRTFIHTSSHCRFAYVRILALPSTTTSGNATTQVSFTLAGGGAPDATAEMSYGADDSDDIPDTISVAQARTMSGANNVNLLPDTDYEVNVLDVANARTIAVCIHEYALTPDTVNGYVPTGVQAGDDIIDTHRQNLTGLLRTAWLRNGAPLITWSSDLDSASPTRTSNTPANLIDGVTGSPTAATAGFTLSLAHRGTLRRGAFFPCVAKVYGKCAGTGNGHVELVDSTGTTIVDVEIDTSTEGWYTQTFDMPAVDGKYDLRFYGDGTNLLTVRAVSIYSLG